MGGGSVFNPTPAAFMTPLINGIAKDQIYPRLDNTIFGRNVTPYISLQQKHNWTDRFPI